MVSIGSVELNLRLDRSEFDRALNDLKKTDLPTLTPKIDIYNLRKADMYVDRLTKRFKDLQRTFDSKPLTPKVDLKQLHDLNILLDKKLSHYKQVQSYFNQNPLNVTYKTSSQSASHSQGTSPSGSSQDGVSTSQLLSEVRGISRSLSSGVKDFADGTKTIVNAVKNQGKKGIIGTIGSAVGNMITSPIKSIGTGFTEEIGRNISSAVSKKSIYSSVKKTRQALAFIDNEIIGSAQVYETFFASVMAGNSVKTASKEAGGRTKVMKYINRVKKLQAIANAKPDEIVKTIQEQIKDDAELLELYNKLSAEFIAEKGGKPRHPKIVAAAVGEKFVKQASPQQLGSNVIMPMVNQLQPLLKFIQGLQAYNTSKLSERIVREREAGFPKLKKGENVISVIGGAQNLKGQGGRQISMALEPLMPGSRLMPVENFDTDASKRTESVDKKIKALIPTLFPGMEGIADTVVNAARQIAFALNPKGSSVGAAQALANTKLARKQGNTGGAMSFSLGGADAYRYAQAAEYEGIDTKALAMAFPFLNIADNTPKGFQAAMVEKDPLTFPVNIEARNKSEKFNILDDTGIGTSSASVHGLHHLFKSPVFQKLFSNMSGQRLPNIPASDLSSIVQGLMELKKVLSGLTGIESFKETGNVTANSPFMEENSIKTAMEASTSFHSIDTLETNTKRSKKPEEVANIQKVVDIFRSMMIKTSQEIKKQFSLSGVSTPDNLGDLQGFLRYIDEVEKINNVLLSFKTGELQPDSWFAGKLEPTEMAIRNRELKTETLPWFKKQPQFGEYGKILVVTFEKILKLQEEFIRTNGNLSPETVESIQLLEDPTADFSPELLNLLSIKGGADTQRKEEIARISELNIPPQFKENQAAILAFNKLLKALGTKMPDINKIQSLGFGFLGGNLEEDPGYGVPNSAALISEDLVYKTALDPEKTGMIATDNEILAHEKLQGRFSPLLYEGIKGEALVTERLQGNPLQKMYDFYGKKLKNFKKQLEDETKKGDKGDKGTIEKIKEEIKQTEKTVQDYSEKYWEQVGRLGATFHEMGIAHNDLSSGNVFIDKNESGDLGVTGAIDFGQATIDPTDFDKLQDIFITIQRVAGLADIIPNIGSVIQRIIAGFKKPFKLPNERTIDPTKLTPATAGVAIPLGTDKQTILQQHVGEFSPLAEIQETETQVSEIQIGMEDILKSAKEIGLILPERTREPVLVSTTRDPSRNQKINAKETTEMQKRIKQASQDVIKFQKQLDNINHFNPKELIAQVQTISTSFNSAIATANNARLHEDNPEKAKIYFKTLIDSFDSAKLDIKQAIEQINLAVEKQLIPPSEAEKVKKKINSLLQGIGKSNAYAKGSFKGLVDAEKIGKEIEASLKGIDASELGVQLAQEVIEGAEEKFEIKSPSKVFIRIGKQLMAGLENGIDSTSAMELFQSLVEISEDISLTDGIRDSLNTELSEIGKGISKALLSGTNPKGMEKNIKQALAIIKTASSHDLKEIAKAAEATGQGVIEFLSNPQLQETMGSAYETVFDSIASGLLTVDQVAEQTLAQLGEVATSEPVKQGFERLTSDIGNFFEEFTTNSPILGKLITSLGAGIKNFGVAILAGIGISQFSEQVIQFTKTAFEAAKHIESLKIALNFSTAEGGVRTIQRLREEANQLGVSFIKSAEGYQQLSAATMGTKLQPQTQQIFKGFQEGMAVRSLPTVQQESVFRAISQIASKGRVSLEELNQQLGEAMPGALQSAARAMGVTSGELITMVENGQILAEDLLPKLSNQLSMEAQSGLGGASKSTQAQLNRLNNTMEELQTGIGATTLSLAKIGLPIFNSALKFVVDNLAIVAIGVTSLSLILIAKLFPALVAVLGASASGAVALNAFGIQALIATYQANGLTGALLFVGKGFGSLLLSALPLVAIGVTIATITKAFTPLNEQIKQASENLKNLNKQKISQDIVTQIDTSNGLSDSSRQQLRNQQQKDKPKFSWSTLIPGSGIIDLFKDQSWSKTVQKYNYANDFNSAIEDIDNLLKKTQSLKNLEIGKTVINDIDKQIKDKQIAIEVAINTGQSRPMIDQLNQQLADLQGTRTVAIDNYIPDYSSTVSALTEAETILNELHKDFKDGKITASMYEQGLDSIIPRIEGLTKKQKQYDDVIKTNIDNIKRMTYALYQVKKGALALENSLTIQQLTSQNQFLNQRAKGEIGDIGLQTGQTGIDVAIAKTKVENNRDILAQLQSVFKEEISADTRRRVGEILNLRGSIESNIQDLSPEMIDLAMNANGKLLENHPELQQALTTLQEITRKRQEGLTLENQLAQSEVTRRKEEEASLNRQLIKARQLADAKFQGELQANQSQASADLIALHKSRLQGNFTPEIAQMKETLINLQKTNNDQQDKATRINSLASELNKPLTESIKKSLSSLSGRNIRSAGQISGAEATALLSLESDQLTPDVRDILEKIQTVRNLSNEFHQEQATYWGTIAGEQNRIIQEIKSFNDQTRGLNTQLISTNKQSIQLAKDFIRRNDNLTTPDEIRGIRDAVYGVENEFKGYSESILSQMESIRENLRQVKELKRQGGNIEESAKELSAYGVNVDTTNVTNSLDLFKSAETQLNQQLTDLGGVLNNLGFQEVATKAKELVNQSKTLKDSAKQLADEYKSIIDSTKQFQKQIDELGFELKKLAKQVEFATIKLNLKASLTPGINSMFDSIINGIISLVGNVQQFALQELDSQQKKMSLGFEIDQMRTEAEAMKIQIDSVNTQRASLIAQKAELERQRNDLYGQYNQVRNQRNGGNPVVAQQINQQANLLANSINNLNTAISSIQIPQAMDYSIVEQRQSQINQFAGMRQQQLNYESQLADIQNQEALLDGANSLISSYQSVIENINNTAKTVQKQVDDIRRKGLELLIDPESYEGRLTQLKNQINDEYDSLEQSARDQLNQIKKEMEGLGDLRAMESQLPSLLSSLRQKGQNAQADALEKSVKEASANFGVLESSFNSLNGALGELSGQRSKALQKAIDDFNKEMQNKINEFEQNQIIEFYDLQGSRIKDREQKAIYEAEGSRLRQNLEFDKASEELSKLIKETGVGAEQAQLWRDRLQAINDIKLDNIQVKLEETRKQIAEERWKAPLQSSIDLFNAEADAEIDPFAAANIRGQGAMLEQQMWFYDQVQNISKMREELGLTAEVANQMYNNLYRINELKMDKIREESNLVAKVLKESVQSAIEENLASFFKFEQDFNATLSGIAKSILKTIADLAAKAAAAQLMKGFMGIFGGLFGGMFGGGPEMSQSVPQLYGPGFYNGGTVQNFAEGGIVQMGLSLMSAMAKERSMGGQPVPIVASVGEEILSTKRGDAQFYRMLRQSGKWDSMKFGNYSDGGTIGNINFGGGGSANNANINITVITPNADSFKKSETQIGREIGERQQRFYHRNT